MTRKKTILAVGSLVGLVFLAVTGYFFRTLGNPNALWEIVHDNCLPSQVKAGKPGKCQVVNLSARFVVFKDLIGSTRFLLLPTDRVSGIESSQLLQTDVPNYWRAAWQARSFVEDRAGLPIPRDWIGLSVNSLYRRSQNQLHIHIDCVQPGLHAALEGLGSTPDGWSATPMLLAGHEYFIDRITSSNLEDIDLFKLLAHRLEDPRNQMGAHSLSAIGMRSADGALGFYVLDSPVGPTSATSDDVLDRRCRLAHPLNAN